MPAVAEVQAEGEPYVPRPVNRPNRKLRGIPWAVDPPKLVVQPALEQSGTKFGLGLYRKCAGKEQEGCADITDYHTAYGYANVVPIFIL